MINDKTLHTIKIITITCVILFFVILVLYFVMNDFKINTIDTEMTKRLNFCENKKSHNPYIYDCNMYGECDITYLDCDFVNSWRDYSLMTEKGEWDLSKLKISYSEYLKKKANPFYVGDYVTIKNNVSVIS